MKKLILFSIFALVVNQGFSQAPTCNIVNDQEPLCAGSSDGGATVTVNGGDPNFTVDWTGGANATGLADAGTNQQTNLANGTYTVTVTDNGGLTGTCSVVMTGPTNIIITSTSTPSSCGSSD
ncbi:MAG: hypothetical protein IH948_05535, partial [Bacteroidetes bacterium]|nr:hypothetical protein [Bacteroidota bacterium]